MLGPKKKSDDSKIEKKSDDWGGGTLPRKNRLHDIQVMTPRLLGGKNQMIKKNKNRSDNFAGVSNMQNKPHDTGSPPVLPKKGQTIQNK